MKIGDTVRFLNSIGGGRVVRLDGQLAYVEDEDGFEVPVLQRECVIVASAADDARMAASVDTPAKASLSSSSSAALRGVAPRPLPPLPRLRCRRPSPSRRSRGPTSSTSLSHLPPPTSSVYPTSSQPPTTHLSSTTATITCRMRLLPVATTQRNGPFWLKVKSSLTSRNL